MTWVGGYFTVIPCPELAFLMGQETNWSKAKSPVEFAKRYPSCVRGPGGEVVRDGMVAVQAWFEFGNAPGIGAAFKPSFGMAVGLFFSLSLSPSPLSHPYPFPTSTFQTPQKSKTKSQHTTQLWLCTFLHTLADEIYLSLTPLEAERLRRLSYHKQLAAGLPNPGSAGTTVQGWGDAGEWRMSGLKGEGGG